MSFDITIRRFRDEDAKELFHVIVESIKVSNIKDYSIQFVEDSASRFSPERLLEKSRRVHLYVVCDKSKIIGCGGVSFDHDTERYSWLTTLFILYEYQRQGIGRKLVQILESDEAFINTEKIKLTSTITAHKFYEKLGYTYENNTKQLDNIGLYHMEKPR